MGVFKRGKTWTARVFWRDQQKKRHSASQGGFKTKKEAEVAGWEAFNIEYGIVTDPMQQFKTKYSKMPFEDYVMKHWFEENKSMWKSTTETGYMKKLRNHIFPTFARRTLGQISSANLAKGLYLTNGVDFSIYSMNPFNSLL